MTGQEISAIAQGAGQFANMAVDLVNPDRDWHMAKKQMNYQVEKNKEMASYNQDLNKDMLDYSLAVNKQYNGVRAKMKDMTDNGLNPALMYGGGGTVTQINGQAGSQSGSAGSMMGVMTPSQRSLMRSQQIAMAGDAAMKAAEIENIKANTDKTKAETKTEAATTENMLQDTILKWQETNNKALTGDLINLQRQIGEAELSIKSATVQEQIETIKDNARLINRNALIAIEELEQAKAETTIKTETAQAVIDTVKASYANIVMDTALKQAGIGVSKAQVESLIENILIAQDRNEIEIRGQDLNKYLTEKGLDQQRNLTEKDQGIRATGQAIDAITGAIEVVGIGLLTRGAAMKWLNKRPKVGYR